MIFVGKIPPIHKQQEKPFLINMLFEKENEKSFTKNAVLYRNILEYRFETDGYKPFRFTDLGKYLMKKNYEFQDYYTDHLRKVTMTNRIANHRQRIQRCIDNLLATDLLKIVGKVKSEKNVLETPLYTFSIEGHIAALLSAHYNNPKDGNQRNRIDKIFELIDQFYSRYNSHIVDFVSRIYRKAKERGFSESVVVLLTKILQSNIPIKFMKDAFNYTLYFHLEKGHTRSDFFNIYMETLSELNEDVRKIVLNHEKAEIESRFHLYQPPKDWEEAWIHHIQDYSKIVLYGVCANKNCYARYPIVTDYYEYRQDIFSGHLKKDCNRCNTKDSVLIYNTLEKKEVQSELR